MLRDDDPDTDDLNKDFTSAELAILMDFIQSYSVIDIESNKATCNIIDF